MAIDQAATLLKVSLMTKREEVIKVVVDELTRWEIQLSNLNAISLFDANIFSEHTICRLLNCAYNYDLRNLNTVQKNFPAIDLADKSNRVAFQITSTKSAKKIQHTIERFISNDLYKEYDQLFILILGKRQKIYPSFNTKQLFEFKKQEHIIDFKYY